MRTVPTRIALALTVALAAGCAAEPDAADTAGAPGTPAADTAAPVALPPPVAGADGDPDTDGMPGPLPVPAPQPDGDGGEAAGPDAGATVPSRFQGSYAANQAACDARGNPTRLDIEAASISFHESTGPITAVSSGPSDITITAELTGEGETREATYTFRLSDDGGTLTDQDGGMERVRCN